jgi:hypothetical protein
MPKPLHPRDSQARKEDSVRRAAEWLCGELSMSQDKKKMPQIEGKKHHTHGYPKFWGKKHRFPFNIFHLGLYNHGS